MGITGEPDSVPDAVGEATTPNALQVLREGDAKFVALDEPEFTLDPGPAKVLPFNRILAAAGFRCNVQEATGVSCLSEFSGKGFTFSPDGFAPAVHRRARGRPVAMKIEAGQAAVVTGGTSGIGFALAALLVRRGVNVMIADVREDAIPTAVDALSRHPGRAVGVHADVSVDADVDALADETMERFGRVDLVCNNAGVVGEQAPMWEQRLQNWRWLIDVKLMGVVHGVRAFAPMFIGAGSGHFLNTASAGGLMPLPTLAPYNATMHAVVGLTETLNAELKAVSDDLGATVLCPGMVDTPLGANSAVLALPGAATIPVEGQDMAMLGAISPMVVAEAAIAAVEAGLVHAVVGPGAAEVARQRVDALLSDLD